MASLDEKISHLTLIQNIITRMASNSFFLKGWAVTLVSAILALASQNSNHRLVLIAYVPLIAFWLLNGFFLKQERMYRKLYEEVIKDENKIEPFSLNAKIFDSQCKVQSVLIAIRAAFAGTLILFYGSIFLCIIIASIYLGV